MTACSSHYATRTGTNDPQRWKAWDRLIEAALSLIPRKLFGRLAGTEAYLPIPVLLRRAVGAGEAAPARFIDAARMG